MRKNAKITKKEWKKYIKPYTYKNSKAIPALNYTEEELNQLNVSESSLGKNILNWMTKSITNKKPTYEEWQKFISDNSDSINTVIELNQRAYDRYLEAINK